MQPPRVAVVIPAYNSADTLARAVASIVRSAEHARTAMSLDLRTEIVVVDDGSTDETAQVLEAIAADIAALGPISFKAIVQANRGAGPARNEGVRHSSAPLITFLDADDEFLPGHLGICVQALTENREIGFVWTRRQLDVPVHPSWGPSLDRSTVMNLCVRRIWHEIAKGFPEHADFRKMTCEDSFYRISLNELVKGEFIPETTVLIHFQPGNSLDRQREKFATPITEWDGGKETAQPTPAILALLQERLEYIERLKAEMSGG